jgi:hypothetical protein
MKKKISLFAVFYLMFLFSAFLCHAESKEIITLENGDQVSWDGSYYDFRDAERNKMIKMWIPPDTKPVKGMFISGHGGGGGDSRHFARDENLRAFAMRLGFAVVGLHNFPGRRVYEDGAPVFFNALNEFAKLGHHPEIANIPFVMYGSSNGGAQTYGFVNYVPERAICFVANVAAGYIPKDPVPEALKVPGIFIMGKFDALVRQRGIDRTQELMKKARPNGARWAWAVELKGHEDGASFDVYMKFVEQAIKARYPEKEKLEKKPLKLIELKEEDGWLVDHDSWGSGLTRVNTYDEYEKDRSKAGWAMNKNMAYVYRSMATYHNPVDVTVKEFDRTYNPHTDPGTMFSLGGPVANPGKKVTILCKAKRFPEWKKIEVFNGADKLGEISSGNEPEIDIVLDKNNMVYCLTALATDKEGNQRTCTPMHFFVRNPSKSWKREESIPAFDFKKTNAGSKNAGKNLPDHEVDHNDSLLIAYGLTADMESSFSANDGKISEFWSQIDDQKDHIFMTPRKHATEDATFNFVLTHDCKFKIKAAYGADGIYLLFEIMDDNDVAWPNQYVATENEMFYYHYDAVDVLMDSRSIHSICSDKNSDRFISPGNALTETTLQYQVACGTPEERPTGYRRSIPDPWDINATYFTFKNAKKYLGVQIELLTTDHFHKAQEWFIPWSEYGGGLEKEPDAGTRLAFAPGYNDRDKGEHFPPGTTSSGGSVKASNSLKWIGKSTPWAEGPVYAKPPYAWGEILIGPMIK